MTRDELVRALSVPLPEDIGRRREAGDLDGALRAILARLARKDLPEMLRARLLCEQERIRRLPTQYPFDRKQALEKIRQLIPDLMEEEFDAWDDQGYLDWIMAGGIKRYFIRFAPSLMRRPDVCIRAGKPLKPESGWLDPMIRRIRETGAMSCRIVLEETLRLEDRAFEPGLYTAWLPFPAAAAQQRDIRLLEGDPDGIAPEGAAARTAWWRRKLEENRDFRLRCSYVSTIRYADPLNRLSPEKPLYPDALPPTPDDLAEDPPFIRFTPYLRSLAAEVRGTETEPARIAWRCYEFVTQKVRYSFMRDYFQIDGIGEYCAVNLKGDCGLQALLFIQLCRINGIPARWQSGESLDEDYVGAHDWTQFWLPGWGWLFADPSYGGSAWRSGAAERHRFYFGNIDPMRMAANRLFEAELAPAGHALRVDPYDNQSGEMEREGALLPFTGRELDSSFTLVSWEEIPEE